MPTENPILDELHHAREELLANAGGTLAGLVARLQQDERSSGRAMLNVEKQRGKRQPRRKNWRNAIGKFKPTELSEAVDAAGREIRESDRRKGR